MNTMQDNLSDYIKGLRMQYTKDSLSEDNSEASPFLQFEKWLSEAITSKIMEPHAMTLSTVDKAGKPSSRIMLLREFGESGFGFYTNYTSKKGEDMFENPNVCLNFFWPEMQRQIRIEGKVTKQSEAVSEAYFKSRPLESKVGAWTSNQSKIIASRKVLDDTFAELMKKYSDENVPKPNHWGGFVLLPEYFEFWQGGAHRLHDRITYLLHGGNWNKQRVSP